MQFSTRSKPQLKPQLADDMLNGEWNVISAQLLNQWDALTPAELECTHHNRRRIALLVQEKYGIEAGVTEQYLENLERTLPRFQ